MLVWKDQLLIRQQQWWEVKSNYKSPLFTCVSGLPLLSKCCQTFQAVFRIQELLIALFFQCQSRRHLHLQAFIYSTFRHPKGQGTLSWSQQFHQFWNTQFFSVFKAMWYTQKISEFQKNLKGCLHYPSHKPSNYMCPLNEWLAVNKRLLKGNRRTSQTQYCGCCRKIVPKLEETNSSINYMQAMMPRCRYRYGQGHAD